MRSGLVSDIDHLLDSQISEWPLLARGVEGLRSSLTRMERVAGRDLYVRHIPHRIVSTTAAVDAASIAKRPCFLCSSNLPKEEHGIPFNSEFAIYCNPFPILERHLTIVRMDETGRNDQGFTVTWAVDNFLNTKFRVAKPEGLIVFAQRRPVRIKGSYEEAVYTAYAPELDTKTMREAGMDYLRHLQRLAYDRIKDHDVRSLVTPKFTVAERIPTGMVVRLMITEHVDPARMKYVGIEQCIHEVLITIAANREHAYAYAKSSAGARGLAQFIDDSYQMVRENYPKALLEPDFERGMSDLHNAVLASVLLLDLELTHLPRDTFARVVDSSQQFAAFLAAGYNRNPVHVVKTYHRTKSFTGGNAPFQNKMYVRMQSWIGGFLKKEYGIT